MIIIFGLIAVVFCICIFLGWFFTHKASRKERLMMIEKGINPNDVQQKGTDMKLSFLKIGIVIIGLSVGLGIIGILVELNALGSSNAFPLAILGASGGLALVIASRLSSKR